MEMTIMKYIASILIIAILVIVVLKMANQGEAVDRVGNKVVRHVERTLAPDASKQSKRDFAREKLGWDFTDIGKQPIRTIESSKIRLQKVITELQKQQERILQEAYEGEITVSKEKQDMKNLLDSIHEAKAYLSAPNSTYPAKINSMVYTSKEQLKLATERNIRSYNQLKQTTTLRENTKSYSEINATLLDEQLELAYQMLNLLDARLALAKVEDYQMSSEQQTQELNSIVAKAQALVDDKDPGMKKMYDSGFRVRAGNNDDLIESFAD